jgi:type IV pilus assembly protein PilV
MNTKAHVLGWQQRGITMVESLVALVVLSVGMLGIAGLHLASLKTGRTALLRTQAVNLVNDMADRIRANPRARDAYDSGDYAAAPATHDCVTVSNCSSAELAEDDLARWLAQVDATLPAAVAAIDFVAAAATGRPDQYSVSVQWTEAGEPLPFSYQASLNFIAVLP